MLPILANRYTNAMDHARFGKALGTGARDAAKAMLKAADAATAPNPGTAASSKRIIPSRPSAPPDRIAEGVAQVRATTTGIKRGSRRFGKAVWGPFVKVSAVVWLEVTGFIFALFALAAGGQVWRHRMDLHTAGAPRNNLIAGAVLLALFGSLTVSSYLRAHRRNRR